MHLAVKKGNKEIVELLIQHQCDLQKKNKQKETALDLCKENTELAQLIQSLLPKPKSQVNLVFFLLFKSKESQIIDAQSAIKEFMQIKSQRTEESEQNTETPTEVLLLSSSYH